MKKESALRLASFSLTWGYVGDIMEMKKAGILNKIQSISGIKLKPNGFTIINLEVTQMPGSSAIARNRFIIDKQ